MHKPALERLIELFCDLPRGGPGSRETTRRALAACAPPPDARVVVMGCGVGQEVITLASALDGWFHALDEHAAFLKQLPDLLPCVVRKRVATVHGDLREPPFEPGSQDLIWAENAVEGVGFAEALRLWRPLLRPAGELVISDTLWRTEAPSEGALAYWRRAPHMSDLPTHLAQIEAAGFELREHFELPEADWWAYLEPLEAALPRLEAGADAVTQQLAEALRQEIATRRAHADEYGAQMFMLVRF